MSVMAVSSEVERLITSEPWIAYVATSVDDRPHVAPVWFNYADGTIEIESLRTSERTPVSLSRYRKMRTAFQTTTAES
jgi:nitroimidazol reductase NimA-like FMN-containing flavoprotein (pyridoxamine 5'-phosphate oxidase superfamily)